jgi:beta-phosphoglucomutase-like phosphatase (HAD superfamily)
MKRKVEIGKSKEEIHVRSFTEMFNKYDYIGFESSEKFKEKWRGRYVIVKTGPNAVKAFNSHNTWSDYQEDYTETYYVFDSAEELYEWMKGKD